MVLCQKTMGHLGELLPRAKEFNYPRFMFTIDGNMEQEMDRWFGVVLWTVVVKKALSNQAKLSIFCSVYVKFIIFCLFSPMVMSSG